MAEIQGEGHLQNPSCQSKMYGAHFGCGQDWYLGSTPIGAFAFNLDIEGGLYVDPARTLVNWNRGDGLVFGVKE